MMAYEVTATRRRPQHFEDLVGQEFVAETLKNSIKTGQIAHAYLFAGPRGCGKTSTARILAKALNCQSFDSPAAEPCGHCESCKSITNSSSLDVIEIDGASNTSVNDVRQIKDEVMFPPTSCRYKIYIIDEVHMLSNSAFNALLKTIEEPPAHVIFIFATTELQKVPATIKSRCQQFNFRLVSVEKLKSLLLDACNELGVKAEDEALYWIAKESGGSVRDCYTLFDQVVAFSDGFITYEKIRDKLGILGVDRLNVIFESCASGKTEDAMDQLDSFIQSGISIEQLISNSTDYLRSLLLIKNGIKKESLLGQSAERFSEKVLSLWNTVQTEQAMSIFLQLYRDIRYSISPRYELELAFSRLCWLSSYVSPSQVKAAIDRAYAVLKQDPAFAENQNKQPVLNQENVSSSESVNHSDKETAQDSYQNFSQPTETKKTSFNANGMPVFSALANNTDGQDGGQNPFYSGGALPPEQSEAEKTPALSYFAQNSENTGFTENPDDEDWSNTAAPEDDSYPIENESKDNEEYAQEFAEQNIEDSKEDVHQSEEIFNCPDGSSITLGKLYASLVTEFAVKNPMLSSVIMQTGKWQLKGNAIETTIQSEYQLSIIEQNKGFIEQAFEKFCGTKVAFEVLLKKNEEKTVQAVEIPNEVKLLCSTFKGSVVGM